MKLNHFRAETAIKSWIAQWAKGPGCAPGDCYLCFRMRYLIKHPTCKYKLLIEKNGYVLETAEKVIFSFLPNSEGEPLRFRLGFRALKKHGVDAGMSAHIKKSTNGSIVHTFCGHQINLFHAVFLKKKDEIRVYSRYAAHGDVKHDNLIPDKVCKDCKKAKKDSK